MGLTVSKLNHAVFGNKRAVLADIAFDNSYAFGGEELLAKTLGMRNIERMEIAPIKGYGFEFDYANKKAKVFQQAPPIVYEEAHVVASNAITLNYPAAAIISISMADHAINMIDIDDTLAATYEAQLNAAIAWGERTTLNIAATPANGVTIYVTYITQAWKEVFDNRARVADMVTATEVAKPGKVLCFIESCNCKVADGTSAMSKPGYIRGGDTAVTLEAEIDWTDAADTDFTTLTFLNTDVITHIDITYIVLPASGFLTNRMIEDEDCTIAAEVGASAKPMLFPCFGGGIPDYTAAAEEAPYTMAMLRDDAVGTLREFKIEFGLIKTLAGTPVKVKSTASDAVSLTYMWGVPSEIPGLVALEVRNAEDLSSVLSAVKVMALGY